ncbi:hypothetical protein [Brevibacillus laterosporus]|uniref:hypothetical protein n=1 Tax=Brevibacillus laterosporus TaxID=1465 RepID=UPI0003B22F1C|nr:hypothetical protein [Brevibacillus laterosporus]ERM19630.1 hypothetical protein P615_12655 [Brevibacillus laterosporus PE36]
MDRGRVAWNPEDGPINLFKRAKGKQLSPEDKNSKFYLGESIERPNNMFTKDRSKSITVVPKNLFER